MWNLIFLNGSWHVVDVTKDDLDNDHVNTYTFFDIGEDRASRSHDWNREICGALLEETDLTTRPENEYIVLDEDDVRAAVAQAFAQGQDHFTLVFDRKSYKDYEKALEIINGYATDTYHYNWHKKMRELRIYL